MVREMKDSGIEWIGKIPKEWKVIKVKKLFHIGRGRVISKLELKENGYPVYSSQTKNNGILGYIETYDFDKSQITWTTDGANAGTVFLREGKYNCTNVCGTLLPKKENEKLKFIEFALKFITPYYKRADINGFKIMNNEMAEIPIIYPPLEEQEKIANYLDKKVTDIDLIIEKTKATIEDYKKYKQSIITEVVTKGLNPNVEMKDSGIEWIGKIPKHWEFLRIQNLFEVIDRRNMNPQAQLLSLYTAIGVKPRADLEEKGNKAITVINYKIVEKNDIIVNKLLAWMGAIAYSDYEGVTSPDYDVYRAKEGKPVNRNYFNNYFRYTQFKGDCFKYGYGIMLMRWRTYSEQFLRLKVPVPPLKEQQQIADYLDKKVSEIDNLIAKKESLISEMEEYKKSLIYECVTGKKEVI